MQKILKWFTILFSFLVPLQTGLDAQACADDGTDYEGLRYMLFNPDLYQNKAWWTFFYSYHLHYLDPCLDGDMGSKADEKEISSEWIKYLKENIPTAEAQAYIFNSLPDSVIQKNRFYQALQQHPLALEYFKFAINDVGFVGNPLDPWATDAAQDSVRKKYLNTLQKGQFFYANTKDAFLKKRYAFQLLKLAFYTEQDKLFNTLYNKHFKRSNSPAKIDWWATHYKAVTLEATHPDSANYLHALVYSNADAKMLPSEQRFSRENVEDVLALAKNDKERADIWILYEVSTPGKSLAGMSQAYQLYPNHKHLPMLVIREINKLEDWLGTSIYSGTSSLAESYFYNSEEHVPEEQLAGQNAQQDQEYLQQLYEQLKTMPLLGRKNPAFYNLALAYLSLMKSDPQQAKQHLNQVPQQDKQVAFQTGVLNLILRTQESNLAANEVQEALGQDFKKLINSQDDVFESQKILYSLSAYLKNQFEKQGLYYLAGLFYYFQQQKFCNSCSYSLHDYTPIHYYDSRASIVDIKKVITLIKKSDKNALEELLLLPYSDANYFLDILSVKYLRTGDLPNAVATLSQIPDNFWFAHQNSGFYDYDPFALGENRSFDSYNRRELIQRMINLEKEALANSGKRARNYLLLGNVWFNLHEGDWLMSGYYDSYLEPVYPENASINPLEKAIYYYQQALPYEQLPEKRAAITYLLAEILTKLEDVSRLKKQAKLYETYRNTQFYKNKNCLTLKDMARS